MEGQYNAATWLLDRHVEGGIGQRVALVHQGRRYTYDDTLVEVWRAQNALRALDVRRGERVAMVVNDEPAFVAWFLGALRSGIVPVPLSTMLTADELGAIVADAGAGVVVLSATYADHLPAIAKQAATDLRAVVILDNEAFRALDISPQRDVRSPEAGIVHRWGDFDDADEAPVAATRPDTPGFWLYSSGTTGTPKGVMHRHANLEATAATYARSVLGIGSDDRCLSVAKLFFAYGLGNSLTFPFSVGAAAVLEPGRPTPAGIAGLAVAERPTLFFATPGFVAALLDADLPVDTFSSVRCTVTAGEALPADLQRRFATRFGHPVLDGIGSTEALHIFISNRADDTRPGSSGTPVPGYEVKLLDDADQEVTGADVPGYLHVKGPSTATGYWSRRDATHAAFRGEWLRTGDVYVRAGDGCYTFLGRNNDMIKAGGIWVSPAEVEGVLVEHADVLEAAVVGTHDQDGLEIVVAFVVPRSGRTIDAAAVDAHCRERMAGFKRPRRLVEVAELPKTPTGKIRRFALRERLAAER
jgi:benzoate-CoA ligase family protein